MLKVTHGDGAVVITVGTSLHYDPLGLVEEVLVRLAPYGGAVVVDLGDLTTLPPSHVERFVDHVVRLAQQHPAADYVLASEARPARRRLSELVDGSALAVASSVEAACALLKSRALPRA